MTEEEERKRGSSNLTLLQEVQAAAAHTQDLHSKYPDLPFAVDWHLKGVAVLLADVAAKLEGLRAGKTYDEA
ncbi:hypothetical protein [Pseudomonas sp. 3JA]|uniref:hypothetical protein n=1 Tax=Pseudomonas sp. 3JA TaxID=3109347 RepID=UPI003009BCAE